MPTWIVIGLAFIVVASSVLVISRVTAARRGETSED